MQYVILYSPVRYYLTLGFIFCVIIDKNSGYDIVMYLEYCYSNCLSSFSVHLMGACIRKDPFVSNVQKLHMAPDFIFVLLKKKDLFRFILELFYRRLDWFRILMLKE